LGRDIEDDGGTAFSGTSVTTWQMLKQTSYTHNSKVGTEKDGAGDTTQYVYDPMDRAIVVTDPAGRRVGTSFDLAGQVSCVWRAWNMPTASPTCGTPNP